MKKQIDIKQGNEVYRQSVVGLLISEKLPVKDLGSTLDNFFIAIDENTVVGTIGLEQYGNCGLLRSLVVSAEYRSANIGSRLVMQLEESATKAGIECMYLLTETAADYFERKGYQKIAHEDAPSALQQSTEFSYVCPQSAIVMKKILSRL